jgi:hemerythrin
MQWSDEYTTGVERLDQQHQTLFKMVADYDAALDEARGAQVYSVLLQALDLYARTHFRFEERCMDEYHCPIAAVNREAHVRFIALLAGFQQRYAAQGFDPTDAHTLVATIDQWLADHIGRIDVQLKPWVQNL